MQYDNEFLAFDFGAESSRAVYGHLENNKLLLREIYRFKTAMLSINNHCYWNIFRFYEEMLHALFLCVHKENLQPASVAVDSWGVDFGFLAEDESILRIPYAYRDLQVTSAMAAFHKIIPPAEIYSLTGISMQPFNSLYQIYAMKCNNDPVLKLAKRLMFIPDLLNYLLCGRMTTEFSFATTSQLYNPFRGDWEDDLLARVGLNASYMNDIILPGVIIGELKDDICRQTGIRNSNIAAVCSHDTGSAIVAVPSEGEDWAYISSGTWSLMGVELTSPNISEKGFKYNFSNEGGAEGTYRYLKNIMGLWLLQQCRKTWADSGEEYSYEDLIAKAQRAVPFKVLLDPDHEKFFNPPDMIAAINEFCELTSQDKPRSPGEYVRAILESLALRYRQVLEQLIETSGKQINTIHIIGGGTRNKLLCQFTADATGRKVVSGPAEGTAAGNILMQSLAQGKTGSLEEVRGIVRNSFDFEYYLPGNVQKWEKAYLKFLKLTKTPE
jgi:rhamnulokinase